VFTINIDQNNAIVEFVLEGFVKQDEIDRFAKELLDATHALVGHEIKISADVRSFKPAKQEVADGIRKVQEEGLKMGVIRVAEIVESDIVAMQLNRLAKESGTDKILRRFWEDDAARDWLINGD
jgi:uncharacterized protein YihD (DUF1040 family)